MYHHTGLPTVAVYPASSVVAAGMSITLYCNVTGMVISYVWERRNYGSNMWSRIEDSNKKSYSVSNIQQSQQFQCVAGDGAGSVASNAATIQVLSKFTFNNILF